MDFNKRSRLQKLHFFSRRLYFKLSLNSILFSKEANGVFIHYDYHFAYTCVIKVLARKSKSDCLVIIDVTFYDERKQH
jgi:hypothetical protein